MEDGRHIDTCFQHKKEARFLKEQEKIKSYFLSLKRKFQDQRLILKGVPT